MLVCTAPELVPWQPDFSSSEQASPDWTSVICEGEQLSNAIEAVDWFIDDPAVQVVLCDSCGFTGCESGGYAHVSRLRSHLMWTPPHIDPDDPFESYQYRASDSVRRHGGVAIPIDEWESWRSRFGLPAVDEFPRTVRRDLLAAWRGDAPIFGQFDSPTRLVELARQRAVAGDPSDLDGALAELESVAKWFSDDPASVVDGALVSVEDQGVVLETIYFDVPDTFDRAVLREWRATARVNDSPAPVFGGNLVLVSSPA